MTYNLTSGTETPVKDKSQEKELLPNLRPNTEDFLTFLCFRGTNALPKELDFQNTANQPSTSGASTSTPNKVSPEKKKPDSKTESKKKVAPKKNDITETEIAKPKIPEKDPKTGFMPFAVRKRAEIYPAKSDNKKIQKKQKQESAANNNKETSNGPRATRANPIDEKSSETTNASNKKGSKRKSAANDSNADLSSTSEKSPIKTKKLVEPLPVKETTSSETSKQNSKTVIKSPKKDSKRKTRLAALKVSSTNIEEDHEKSSNSEKCFSSEDDEPLVKTEQKNKKQKILNDSVKSINETFETTNATKNETINSNTTINDSQPIKAGRGRKKKVVATETEKPKESEPTPEPERFSEKKKAGRKKKISVDAEIANSQANTTDLSENETRGRPMRKTKEAATIYMELIGRKLTLHDSSDNDSSLDSLEVPNLKRVELMEIELKANNEKAKEAEAEKKKQNLTDEKKASTFIFNII